MMSSWLLIKNILKYPFPFIFFFSFVIKCIHSLPIIKSAAIYFLYIVCFFRYNAIGIISNDAILPVIIMLPIFSGTNMIKFLYFLSDESFKFLALRLKYFMNFYHYSNMIIIKLLILLLFAVIKIWRSLYK